MDPFEEAWREVERARRLVEAQMAQAWRELERAAAVMRAHLDEERRRVSATSVRRRGDAPLAGARRRFDATWWQQRRGRPGSPPCPEPGPAPDPAPVRPFTPSGLSGGAAAPLEP